MTTRDRNTRGGIAGFVLAVFLTCATGEGARADDVGKPVALPDTPAGKQLAAWLDVLNSGDRDRIRQYVSAHYGLPHNDPKAPQAFVDWNIAHYIESGGFDVRRVVASSPENVKAYARGRQSGYWFEISMTVAPADPEKFVGTYQRSIETPAELLPQQKLPEREIAARADALVTHLVNAEAFSGAILIAKDGKPVYERAAGMASRAWGVPNRVDTKFNLASIGKMFTAVAIAQLVEQGKLHYDDTVGTILPDYPNKPVAEKVRVSHLLSHTSGLSDKDSGERGVFARRYRAVSNYLPTFANFDPAFEPGKKFLYSNAGYNLLGAIIEKASGQSYYDYMRDHIFKPAGMNNTDNYDLDTDVPNLACGYMSEPDGRRRNNIYRLPVRGIPCGLGYSTAPDMLKFDIALRNHTLLREQSLKELWTPRIDNKRSGQYGYGCQIRNYAGTRVIWHGGGFGGVTNQFEMYPELGYTVVILNNIDSNPVGLARKIREWITRGTK